MGRRDLGSLASQCSAFTQHNHRHLVEFPDGAISQRSVEAKRERKLQIEKKRKREGTSVTASKDMHLISIRANTDSKGGPESAVRQRESRPSDGYV